jgi:Fe-S oxidoreductase
MNIRNWAGNMVVHHTEFLKSLLDDGRLTIEGGQFKGKRITFHDPCYLGRANI